MSKIIKSFTKNLYKIFYKSTMDFMKNDGIEQAGYIAFLIIFAFFPFVIFFTSVIGLLGETELGLEFMDIIINMIPKDMTGTIVPRMEEIVTGPSPSILSLAFLSILWTASSLIEGLRAILNKVYRVKNTPNYILRRILSIVQFSLITFTIVTSIFGLAILPKILQRINDITQISEFMLIEKLNISELWTLLGGLIMYVILFLMISLIYYLIPNKKQKIGFVFPGALVTLIGWVVSGKLFAIYLKNFNQFNLVYGSLGGVIISLIFFHIVSIILIYGAEFNYYFGEKFLNKYMKKLNSLQNRSSKVK